MLSLMRLVIFGFLIYLVYRLAKWIILSPAIKGRDVPGHQVPAAPGEELVEDPYCHIYVPMSQANKTTIDGQDVYFCSQKCLEKYISEHSTKKAQGAA
jgi:YHS domain-containing protein